MWTDAGGHVDCCFPKCWSRCDSQEAESGIQDRVLVFQRSGAAGFPTRGSTWEEPAGLSGAQFPVCEMELPVIILAPEASVRLKQDGAFKSGIQHVLNNS